jgi:hypothetical protein
VLPSILVFGLSIQAGELFVSGVPALIMTPYLAGTYTLAPIVATLPAQSLGSTKTRG